MNSSQSGIVNILTLGHAFISTDKKVMSIRQLSLFIGIATGLYSAPCFALPPLFGSCPDLFFANREERIAEYYERDLGKLQEIVANNDEYATVLESIQKSGDPFSLPKGRSDLLVVSEALDPLRKIEKTGHLPSGEIVDREKVKSLVNEKIESTIHSLRGKNEIVAKTVAEHGQIRSEKKYFGGVTERNHVRSVMYRPDGKQILSYNFDGKIQLWDRTDPSHPRTTIQAMNDGDRFHAIYSPDGKRVLGLSPDFSPTEWDVETGAVIRKLPPITSQTKASLAYRPDGRRFLVTGSNFQVREMDVETGKITSQFTRKEEDPHYAILANTAVYSPDGKRVAVAYGDGVVQEWSLDSTVNLIDGPRVLPRPDPPYRRDALSIAYSPDGNKLIVGYDMDGTILWDLKTKSHEQVYKRDDHNWKIWSVAFHPDGKRALIGGIYAWREVDVQTGKILSEVSYPDHEHQMGYIRSVAYDPTGNYFLTGSSYLIEWDLNLVRTDWDKKVSR